MYGFAFKTAFKTSFSHNKNRFTLQQCCKKIRNCLPNSTKLSKIPRKPCCTVLCWLAVACYFQCNFVPATQGQKWLHTLQVVQDRRNPSCRFFKREQRLQIYQVGKKGNCKQKLQTSDVLDLKLYMERKNTSHLYKQISVLSLFSPLSYLCTKSKYANFKKYIIYKKTPQNHPMLTIGNDISHSAKLITTGNLPLIQCMHNFFFIKLFATNFCRGFFHTRCVFFSKAFDFYIATQKVLRTKIL